MKEQLREVQEKYGAIFRENHDVPESFNRDRDALTADPLLIDRSDLGVLWMTGSDRLRFLHNQTTNRIDSIRPDRGMETIFVNSTGRTLDLATVYATEDSLLILVDPNRRSFLLPWIDRYIFPMDKVEITDVSDNFGVFTLIGDRSGEYLQKIGVSEEILAGVEGDHREVSVAIGPIRVAVGTGLDLPGYTLIVPVAILAPFWEELVKMGAIPAGSTVWETLRVRQGRPAADRELTEDYNALEAGLWRAISFEKGCYIGQETIARLNTYKGVKQRLWGIQLDRPVEVGTAIEGEAGKIGEITSVVDNFALGYVKTKAGGPGLAVKVGEAKGEVVAVPYLRHEYL
ncbi:folate-binding protein [Pannus brasiliensis CCIBt3594]|uniref:Folate-binding protein n=1 Tax=Pannus brasiliensis CCIBt3594 TaxID=1427578 RepID=A0AAW9QMR5_9CHRO